MSDTHIDLLGALSAKEAALVQPLVPPPPVKPRRRTHSMVTEAPTVSIRYECSVCMVQVACDPYDGPPTCEGSKHEQYPHAKAWMRAVSLISDRDPLADVRDSEARGGVR